MRAGDQGCRVSGTREFSLPEEAWWEGYYDPFLQKVARNWEEPGDPGSRAILHAMKTGIDLFRKYSRHYGYQAFLLRKA